MLSAINKFFALGHTEFDCFFSGFKWLLKGRNVMRRYLSAVMLINLNAKTIPPFQQYRHRTYDESLVLHVSLHGTIPPSSLYHILCTGVPINQNDYTSSRLTGSQE